MNPSPVRPPAVVCTAFALVLAACDPGGGEPPAGVATRPPPVVPAARAGGIAAHPLAEFSEAPTAPLFEAVGAGDSGIEFGMQLGDFAERAKEYMFITPLGGIAAGDYDADGLPDLYVTSPRGGNRLFRNLGGFRFEDVTEAAGVADADFWGTGAGFVDIEGDGDLDLYACGYLRPNKIYLNDGAGRFADAAGALGLDFDGASMNLNFADADGDGDLDAYLATTTRPPPPGVKFGVRMVPQEDGSEKPVIPDELAEYWELIYLPGKRVHRAEAGQADRFYRNEGGRFIDATDAAGIAGNYFTLSATWWDFDDDGDPDLYVSNDFTGPDFLYRNRGDGTFEDVAADVLPHTPWFSMGSETGDFDGDGRIDLFATDMAATSHYRDKIMMGNMDDMGWFLEFAQPRQYMRNALYLATGTPRVKEAARLAGVGSSDWTWSPRMEDFDGDGQLDLFVTNGILRDSMHSDISAAADAKFRGGSPEWRAFWAAQPMRLEHNLAFRGLGDLKSEKVARAWGLDREGVSFGTATADFDGDGDLDLAVSNADAPVSLYRNGSSGTRLTVALDGAAPNTRGLGAVVTVEAGGRRWVREMNPVRGWLSSSQPLLHFGLAEAERIDALTVRWRSGTVQRFEGLAADRHYLVTEPVPAEPRAPSAPPQPLFSPIELGAEVAHTESGFDDFKLQPLLPNRQSTFGPAVAWGDCDGDGAPDLFLGGAAGIASQLFLNRDGRLVGAGPTPFAAAAASEDVDALWFDADGDGDLDLAVACGSNEFPPGDPRYRDRLYLNDGAGTLAAAATFPAPATPTGALAAFDADADGDLDLIAGGAARPGEYPLASPTALLANAGDGRFIATSAGPFDGLGLVRDLATADLDGDGREEVVAAVEWGTLRAFAADPDGAVERTAELGLDTRSGWWNALAAGDVDGDGDIDLVATNFGLNTKYKADAEHPELLFYGDFDNSGRADIVEAKFEGDRCLPRRGFSCSSDAMPFLKAKLGTFHNFASSTLSELYTDPGLGAATRLEADCLEHVLWRNDGGALTPSPLPRAAQIAPSFGAALADVDADGDLDLALAQNFFSPQRETGRMDGGLSMILLGDGAGGFAPVPAARSGIALGGDTRSVTAIDLDGDGRPELCFAENDGPLHLFRPASP